MRQEELGQNADHAMPLVSVLMAVYNAQEDVSRAVQSVQEQTYTNWELIVVDDGSTDGTAEILAALADSDERIILVRRHPRAGLAVALNAGLAVANGDLIARMDADDRSLPNRLDRQVALMVARQEIAVCGTGAYLVVDGKIVGRSQRPTDHEELAARILTENPFFHPSVMVRRKFYQAMEGYDPGMVRAQDYDLWLRGVRSFVYCNLQEPLIEYTLNTKPSWKSIYYGTLALLKALHRERRLLSGAWFPLRYLIATALTSIGLRPIQNVLMDREHNASSAECG